MALMTDDVDTAEVGGAAVAGLGPLAGALALAQKVHDEYVSEGHNTRERLISEGQSRHDQVVGEATARHEELLATGQAKHDEFVSVGEARREALRAEADALIAEAQQQSADVLQALNRERSLLLNELEELRAFNRDHRAQLKSLLREQADRAGAHRRHRDP